MLDAIKYQIRHLTDFSGRDARQTFWFWFLFLFLLNIAVSLIATVPMMIDLFSTAFEAAQRGDDPAAAQQAAMAQMAGSMQSMLGLSLALGIGNTLLMAAAFVRRLHDSGKPGVWALVAGAIYLGSIALAWSRIDEAGELMRQVAASPDPQAALSLQRRMAVDGLLGWVPMIMLVVFGVMKSDPGPNKYGADPVRF